MTQATEDVLEVFLQPGETWFGDRNTRIRTILGSCISVTLWHPARLMGGMCHFMLPRRSGPRGAVLDGRYGDEAVELLLIELRAQGTRACEYEAKLFGGGAMFADLPSTRRMGDEVGAQNARVALDLMAMHGFRVTAKHVGGAGHRNLIFDLWSGDVWMKHVTDSAEPGIRWVVPA